MKRVCFLMAAALTLGMLSMPAHAFDFRNLFKRGYREADTRGNEIGPHFRGKTVYPKMDLPRGDLIVRGGVVDFAEIDRLIAVNGTGPRKGVPIEIDEADVYENRAKFVFREGNKKPDPRGLGIELRPYKGERFDEFRSAQALEEFLTQLFDFAPPAPAAPQYVQVQTAPLYTAPAPEYRAPALSSEPAPQPASFRPASSAVLNFSIGSKKADVFAQLGEPLKRDVTFEGADVVERWFYEFRDMTSLFVVFRNGAVENLKKF
jgi:hypothetical protein